MEKGKTYYLVCQESWHDGWRIVLRTEEEWRAKQFLLHYNNPDEPRYWIEEERDWD